MTTTPTVAPQPVAPELSPALLDRLRAELVASRDQEAHRALRSRRVADDLLAQGAAGMTEAEVAERSAARAEAAVAAIDAAVRRIDDGTYGWCQGCGSPIPADRLEAIAWAPRCRPCADRAGAGFLR